MAKLIAAAAALAAGLATADMIASIHADLFDYVNNALFIFKGKTP